MTNHCHEIDDLTPTLIVQGKYIPKKGLKEIEPNKSLFQKP